MEKLNCKSFMIGDWVLCTYPSINKPVRVAEIKTVGDNTLKVVIYYDDIRLVFNEIYIEPVPLTAEILEKNGWKREFDKTDYMVKYDLEQKGKYCWMMWAIKEHNLDIQKQDEKLDMYNLKVQRACIPCDYVHELQHALHLCEIEHEIIL